MLFKTATAAKIIKKKLSFTIIITSRTQKRVGWQWKVEWSELSDNFYSQSVETLLSVMNNECLNKLSTHLLPRLHDVNWVRQWNSFEFIRTYVSHRNAHFIVTSVIKSILNVTETCEERWYTQCLKGKRNRKENFLMTSIYTKREREREGKHKKQEFIAYIK